MVLASRGRSPRAGDPSAPPPARVAGRRPSAYHLRMRTRPLVIGGAGGTVGLLSGFLFAAAVFGNGEALEPDGPVAAGDAAEVKAPRGAGTADTTPRPEPSIVTATAVVPASEPAEPAVAPEPAATPAPAAAPEPEGTTTAAASSPASVPVPVRPSTTAAAAPAAPEEPAVASQAAGPASGTTEVPTATPEPSLPEVVVGLPGLAVDVAAALAPH